jgi:hypothetical protein
MKPLLAKLGVVTVSSLCAVACSSSSEHADDDVGGAGDGSITRTVVHLDGDRPPVVTTTRLSAGEAAAEVSARAARTRVDLGNGLGRTSEAITADGTCAGADLWLNDGLSQTGNRLCFYGSGQVSLSSICLANFRGTCLKSWSGAVRSYWAGADPSGYFNHYASAPPAAPDCEEFFLSYYKADTALACAQKANYVKLGSDFIAETFGRPVTVPATNPDPPVLYLDVPNAGGDVHVTPTSGARTVHVGANDVFTLTAVADDPGGVQSVALKVLNDDITVRCTSGSLGQTKFYLVKPPSSVATGGVGSLGYTRSSVGWTIDVAGWGCAPGWTLSSFSMAVSAQATNYSGVGSGATPWVTFQYP